MHPVIAEFEEHAVRRRPYRGYLIFYKALNDMVEITRILHGARDYGAMLSGDFE
jgi:toxin ParE1/3/4